MDSDRQVLEEIRDLVKQQLELQIAEAERARRHDEARGAQVAASLAMQVATARLYKRVVAVGAVLIVALLAYLFLVLPRSGS